MMGAEAAVNILYKKEITQAPDPKKARQEKIQEYQEAIVAPYYSASKQYIDAVIRPADTRRWFIHGLKLLKDKKTEEVIVRKHGNLPL
jgi:propionyl-CoA carboxylase beta chain